jgi:glycosyltransferase involved in cell wall biosynthesis
MPRFSLIVGTLGRTNEFAVLLQSLAEQQMRDFELIVVDQNSDDRLTSMLKNWAAHVSEHKRQDWAGGHSKTSSLHPRPLPSKEPWTHA